VPQSAAAGAAVEPLEDFGAFGGPASGVAGDRGDDLCGARSDEAQRRPSTTFSSSSGLVHAQREGTKPASPGHGKGRRRLDAGLPA
jgi:hypothetical protein